MEKNGSNEAIELKKEIEALKRDFLKLGDSLEKIVSEKIEKNFEDIKESVKDKISQDNLEKLDDLKIKSKNMTDLLKTEHEAHPLLSIMVAAGVGYIVGKISNKI